MKATAIMRKTLGSQARTPWPLTVMYYTTSGMQQTVGYWVFLSVFRSVEWKLELPSMNNTYPMVFAP